jgi:hypothetical protein
MKRRKRDLVLVPPFNLLSNTMGIEVVTDKNEFCNYVYRSSTVIDNRKTFNHNQML